MTAFVSRVIAGLDRVDVAAASSSCCRRRFGENRRRVLPSISDTRMRLVGTSPYA